MYSVIRHIIPATSAKSNDMNPSGVKRKASGMVSHLEGF